LNKVYGNRDLAETLQSGGDWRPLVASWQPFLAQFNGDRAPYLLYG
jgi:hypothetical protein